MTNYLSGLPIRIRIDLYKKTNIHKINMLEKYYENITFEKEYSLGCDGKEDYTNLREVSVEGDDKERIEFVEEMVKLNMDFKLKIYNKYIIDKHYIMKEWILDLNSY